jgi:hypothetical protein
MTTANRPETSVTLDRDTASVTFGRDRRYAALTA